MPLLLARFVTEAWGYTEMACSNPFAFTKGYEKLAYHTVIKIFFRTLGEKKDDKDGGQENLQGD